MAFHQSRYTGANIVVSAAGRLDHASVVDLVGPVLEELPRGEKISCHSVSALMRYSGPRRCDELRHDLEQAHLCIGFHACSRNDEARHALKLLNVLLGENMSSRLFQVLREEHGLCYSVFSDLLMLEDTGLLTITTGLAPENVSRALELISRCLREFGSRQVTAQQLEMAANFTIGQSRMALETSLSQMMWCGESVVAYGKIIDPADSFEKLRGVTRVEIRELAERIFRPRGTALAYIGADVPDLALNAFLS